MQDSCGQLFDVEPRSGSGLRISDWHYIEAGIEKNDCAEKRKTNKIIVQYSKITAEN